MRRMVLGWVALAGLSLAACGDPSTGDARGYTKAPLEDPNLLIAAEEPSAMAALGEPRLPRAPTPEALLGDRQPAEDATPEEQRPVSLAPGVTQEQFDQGKQVFGGQGGCMACHGPSGGGSQLGPDLTDGTWLHIAGPDVQELITVIRDGVSQPVEHPAPMPPMGGANLSDEQLQAVAAYVASIGQG